MREGALSPTVSHLGSSSALLIVFPPHLGEESGTLGTLVAAQVLAMSHLKDSAEIHTVQPGDNPA